MSTIDDIRARLDIVDVVADYVPELKRSGKNYHARCPFHQEHTPSFVVFPDTQTWRCFGACATGGNVFTFVMRSENVDFTAAMKSLASRAGVPIEERPASRQAENPLFSVNEAAQQLFKQAFTADRGSQARAYVEARGIGEEAVARFGLGYAPSTGEELLHSLTALGFEEELLLRSGLVLQTERGAPRDMFRGRLMFPLRNADGGLVGFAGRSLDGSNPKYVNTAQTAIFDKGRMFYALDRAKDAITAEGMVVVVEGYMDVIAAHEHGYRNVVASMGTALTEHQVALLKARAQSIVLALDADAAGQEAMLQTLRSSWELIGTTVATGRRRMDVLNRPDDIEILRVALITGGKDPDEMIRTDPAQWQRLIADAVPAVEFLMRAESERLDLTSAQGKSAFVDRLLPVVFAVPDWVAQERYFQRLADMVGVPLATLEAAVDRRPGALGSQARPARPVRQTSQLESAFVVSERDPLEERVLALIAQDEELLARVHEVEPDNISRIENRALLSAVLASGTIEGALAQLDGQLADRLVQLSQEALPPADRKQRAAEWEACLRRLEERKLRELKAQEEAAFAENADGDVPTDPEYVQSVNRQALEINERLRNLFVGGSN